MSFFKKMKDRFTKPNATVSLQLSKNGLALAKMLKEH